MKTSRRSSSSRSIVWDIVALVFLTFGVAALVYAHMIDSSWLSHEDRREVKAHLVSRDVYTTSDWVPDDDSDDYRKHNPKGEDWNPFNKDEDGHWDTDYNYELVYEYYVDDIRHTFTRGYSDETPPEEMIVHAYLDDDGEWKVAEDSNTLIPWALVGIGVLLMAPRVIGLLRGRRDRAATGA